jgi:hypothetical protein
MGSQRSIKFPAFCFIRWKVRQILTTLYFTNYGDGRTKNTSFLTEEFGTYEQSKKRCLTSDFSRLVPD